MLGRTSRRAVLALLIGACAPIAAVGAMGTNASSRAGGSGSCFTELARTGRFYRPVVMRVTRKQLGPLLAVRAGVRCERALVCLTDRPCFLRAGRPLRSMRVRRVRGIPATKAIIDRATRRVYANLDTCFPEINGKVFSCTDPNRVLGDPAQTPPPAYVGDDPTFGSLPFNEFCWTQNTGGDNWVQRCLLFIVPWLRKGYALPPLVVTEPGGVVPVRLGLGPAAVHLIVFTPSGAAYSTDLAPSAVTQWDVPTDVSVPDSCFVEIFVERPKGVTSDFARYVARLHVRQPS